MRLDTFLNRSANLLAENRLLKFAILAIAGSTVVFGMLAYRAVKYETVVLVPFGFDERIVVRGDRVNEEYLLHMARAVFSYALDYTPSTVQSQYELLLSMMTSEAYARHKPRFQALIEEAQTGKLVSVFVLKSLKHKPEGQTVLAEGERLLMLEGSRVVERKPSTFAWAYLVKGGRMLIRELGEWEEIRKAQPENAHKEDT